MKLLCFLAIFAFTAEAEEVLVLKKGTKNSKLIEVLSQHAILLTDQNKFVLTDSGQLRISLTGRPLPNHDDLGKGHKVTTAGSIRFFQTFNDVTKIELSNRSKAYCPKLESLSLLNGFFDFGPEEKKGAELGLNENTSPECKPLPKER